MQQHTSSPDKSWTDNQDKDTLSGTDMNMFRDALLSEIESANYNTGIKNKETNYVELLNQSEIKPEDVVTEPPVCLVVVSGGQYSVLSTLGNFSLVIGKAKSRKSFFIGIALSAAISNNSVVDKIKGLLPAHQDGVLYFDTEQSKYHVHKSVNRICTMSGIQKPLNFKIYGIRKFPPAQRLALIETALYSSPQLGFVVIDGIRDLVTSINDEEQATEIASLLLKWTEELNIHILCVLHQNKGDNNARGHLGTELQNKAETVLSITKDKDKSISIVEAEFCREKEFEPFAFRIDENGIPLIIEDWVFKQANSPTQKGIMPSGILHKIHWQTLATVFAKSPKPSYSDLVSQIKLAFEDQGKRFGDNKAKDFIAWYLNEGFITAPLKPNTRASFYSLNPEPQ